MTTHIVPRNWANSQKTHAADNCVMHAVSDSYIQSPSCRAFMVDVSGTLKVDMGSSGADNGNGTGVVLPVLAGVMYPISIIKAYSTGTSGPTKVYYFW